jgi:hypothetical protein
MTLPTIDREEIDAMKQEVYGMMQLCKKIKVDPLVMLETKIAYMEESEQIHYRNVYKYIWEMLDES